MTRDWQRHGSQLPSAFDRSVPYLIPELLRGGIEILHLEDRDWRMADGFG